MASKTTTKSTKIPVEQVAKELDQGIAGADEARSADLAGLGRLRQVKAASQERSARRLAARYGKNDPRVRALAEKAAVNRALTRQLAFERDRSLGGAPAPDPNGWIVHGHVRNADLSAAPGLTVALYDAKGTWIRQLGHDCTDAAGHFQLSYSKGEPGKPDPDRPGEETDTFVPGSGQDSLKRLRDTPVFARAVATTRVQLFVRVFDKNGQQLRQDGDALTPEVGAVDYREIILGEGVCPPPEPGPAPKPGDPSEPPKEVRPVPPRDDRPVKPPEDDRRDVKPPEDERDDRPREDKPPEDKPREDKPGDDAPGGRPVRPKPVPGGQPLQPARPVRERPVLQPVRRVERRPRRPETESDASGPAKAKPAKTKTAKAKTAKTPAKPKKRATTRRKTTTRRRTT